MSREKSAPLDRRTPKYRPLREYRWLPPIPTMPPILRRVLIRSTTRVRAQSLVLSFFPELQPKVRRRASASVAVVVGNAIVVPPMHSPVKSPKVRAVTVETPMAMMPVTSLTLKARRAP